jgi:hypothetical protein
MKCGRRTTCRQRCGRVVTVPGAVCGPCRKALSEGYYLSPARGEGSPEHPEAERRIALYAERYAARLPLFDAEERR